jgi:hypothetical protein
MDGEGAKNSERGFVPFLRYPVVLLRVLRLPG